MKLKVGKQFRFFSINRTAIDKEKRTIELSFSSEAPVERWWGIEILDHNPKSANLRRLKRGGALLIDHDMRNQVGVIEEALIDGSDRMGRAKVRFGRSTKAEEIFQDVIDEIRSNVSVGYQVNEAVLEKEVKDGPSTYRITDWEPYEISLVSVPADITVGVGRSEDEIEAREIEVKLPPKKEERQMEKCAKCGAELKDGKCPACEALLKREADIAATRVIEAQKTPNALEMEKARIRGIDTLCKMNKLDERYREMWVTQGISLDKVAEDILKLLEERGKTNPQPESLIGLTGRETQRFSLTRAIRAAVDKDWTMAPFELECSRAVAQKLGKVNEPLKFFVPYEVQQRPVEFREKRDVSVAASGGGYLVAVDNVGFIEMLRARSVAFRMGVRRLSGLVGNVTIPKQSGAATAYWLGSETTQITESQQTFVQVALTPKSCGAYTEISRQLLLQSSPGVEGLVTNDLATVVALGADTAILNGSGGAQPQGIIGTSGIGSVSGTTMAAAGIIEFQTDVATGNVVPVSGGYVATPVVAGLLMTRGQLTYATSPLWNGGLWDGRMVGFPAMSSNQIPTGDLMFGDWNEVVVGEWGVLEVEVNPYANFQAGIIGVRAIYSLDCALRRAVAFSLATSVT
jgi:HK97 family phage major capsid protein